MVAFGSNGASSAAKIATNTQPTTMATPIMPTGLSRIRPTARTIRVMPGCRGAGAATASVLAAITPPSTEPDARIQVHVPDGRERPGADRAQHRHTGDRETGV